MATVTIKNEFMKLKSFESVNSYTMRDTGDIAIPGAALQIDVERKVWKYPN